MIKIIAKRFLPLFLALVVVISLFPAVPALAEDVAPIADYTLSGVWTFKSRLSISEYISQNINFISGGTSYVSIQVCPEDGRDFESDVVMYCTSGLCYQPYVGGWRYDCQTVDFGSTPQTVSLSFYNWVVSNATQQSSPETVYFVSIDGSSFQYSSTAESITLDLIITANDYKISVDGSEEDYRISDTVLNNDRQQFAGLSVNGVVDQVDYGIGQHEIILTPSDSSLLLGTVWKYPLYIDPNVGTWNGSSSVSVFWELPNTDTDEISDPVRAGYTFNGWTFTGDGEFNDVGDPPYIYEHGTAPGYLTANWIADSSVPEPSESYTHTIIIDGTSYVFAGETGAPPVTFDVRDDYVIMICGDQQMTWYYQGSGTFLGIRNTATGELHGPAAWFSMIGSSGSNKTTVFEVVFEDSGGEDEFVIPAGQYEANKYVMTGEYLDLPSWPSDLDSVSIVFISSGATYHSMSMGLYLPTSQVQLQYGSTAAYRYAQANNAAGFVQDAFALVYLASDQEVPEAFYNWFTSSFTRISDDPAEPVYTTTINIYDVTGAKLLASWSLSAPGAAPSYTFSVLENGIFISSDATWTWTEAAEPFYGFSLSAGSSAAAFAPGEVSTFTGSSSDFTLDLFVTSELNDKVYQTGVIGWFERIFDKLSEFVDSNLIFPELGDFLSVVDFGSVGSFFVDMYQNVTSVFGLKTLIEDPAGPFAWLMAS